MGSMERPLRCHLSPPRNGGVFVLKLIWVKRSGAETERVAPADVSIAVQHAVWSRPLQRKPVPLHY